jgi:2-methylaconitate cis-trans-isomerase PrpF
MSFLIPVHTISKTAVYKDAAQQAQNVMLTERDSVPVVYARGRTNKALFFHEHDIPPKGHARDRFLRRMMGSPDPIQIDGMGGTHIVNSKIAIIRPSKHLNVDVDYMFVQVRIDNNTIGYSGNCCNISSAVCPFAIDEGLVLKDRKGFIWTRSCRRAKYTSTTLGPRRF